ncbi:MAG TPA: ABC transporter substrate-binding protein [Alphaproteobacteria bacterium]|nr:ABC transporter substrate-binding protein [Alphaproteobacteria bacterium]
MRRLALSLVTAAVLGLASTAMAADNVKIGVIMPLSGNSASAGQSAKAAIELAAQIVNEAHPELKNLPLAATAGLPNLGGAKTALLVADHQGNPSEGQNQTLRLITQEHVVAMLGSYQSNVSFTATAVAERYGIPFVVGDSVAANITGRGFKWVFRVTPVATDFANNYMDFLADLKKAGHPASNIAVVYENTDYGTSVAGTVREAAKSHGINVVADIAYNANAADVSPQVLQLKEKKPDCIIFISYTADTILYMKTMKNLDYLPPLIIGDDSGFSDPAFIKAVGDISQGVINRSAWDIGPKDSTTWKINEMYKAKTGHDMDDTSARDMQAAFVLFDAINRAGSTKPEAIQKALQETDLKPDQLMMGYKGVKFDKTGQNILAATYLIQLIGKDYVAVWPPKSAQHPLIYPFKGWK